MCWKQVPNYAVFFKNDADAEELDTVDIHSGMTMKENYFKKLLENSDNDLIMNEDYFFIVKEWSIKAFLKI